MAAYTGGQAAAGTAAESNASEAGGPGAALGGGEEGGEEEEESSEGWHAGLEGGTVAGGEGGCFIPDVWAHSRSTFQACLGLQSPPGHMTVCENGNFIDFLLDILDTVDKVPISKTNEGLFTFKKSFSTYYPQSIYYSLVIHSSYISKLHYVNVFQN